MSIFSCVIEFWISTGEGKGHVACQKILLVKLWFPKHENNLRVIAHDNFGITVYVCVCVPRSDVDDCAGL